jgi:hypothetical protein
MNRWELYVTWGLLAIIAFGVSSVSRHLTQIHNEIAEIRRKLGIGDEQSVIYIVACVTY